MKSEYTDEQLIDLVHENSEDAKSVLFDRYKDKIDYLIRKYTIVAKTLGIDIKDLNQEALVGFTDAILNYIPGKEASLSTYICLCVERKIKKACIKASTSKHQAMKDTLGLGYKDIAEVLDKETKQIDNAIQRIKGKIKKILEERNM